MKQTSFWKKPKNSHGGSLAKGRRKSARPIVTKSPMHLCLKSSRAKSDWSLLRRKSAVEDRVYKTAQRFRVSIRLYQNVGNHLHLVVQARTRRDFQNFLRVLPQAIMFLVTGARKGNAQGKFWDGLAFSRVIQWGKDWLGIQRYLVKNQLEGEGIPRETVDRWFREAWA